MWLWLSKNLGRGIRTSSLKHLHMVSDEFSWLVFIQPISLCLPLLTYTLYSLQQCLLKILPISSTRENPFQPPYGCKILTINIPFVYQDYRIPLEPLDMEEFSSCYLILVWDHPLRVLNNTCDPTWFSLRKQDGNCSVDYSVKLPCSVKKKKRKEKLVESKRKDWVGR